MGGKVGVGNEGKDVRTLVRVEPAPPTKDFRDLCVSPRVRPGDLSDHSQRTGHRCRGAYGEVPATRRILDKGVGVVEDPPVSGGPKWSRREVPVLSESLFQENNYFTFSWVIHLCEYVSKIYLDGLEQGTRIFSICSFLITNKTVR